MQNQNGDRGISKRRLTRVAAALIGGAALAGCGIVADVDRDVYALGEEGETTLQNFTEAAVFLPGCAPFEFEQLHEGIWQPAGRPFECFWEGIALPVAAGERVAFAFSAPSSGRWRLLYPVGIACDPEAPLSEEACAGILPIRTPAFDVVAPHPSACGPAPGAPNILCPDGVHFSGPGACVCDDTGQCGYEWLTCPE